MVPSSSMKCNKCFFPKNIGMPKTMYKIIMTFIWVVDGGCKGFFAQKTKKKQLSNEPTNFQKERNQQ